MLGYHKTSICLLSLTCSQRDGSLEPDRGEGTGTRCLSYQIFADSKMQTHIASELTSRCNARVTRVTITFQGAALLFQAVFGPRPTVCSMLFDS